MVCGFTGANKDIVTKNKSTCLIAAVLHNQLTIVDMLLTAGADVSVTDGKGNSALHIASMLGFTIAVGKLKAAGANLDQRNNANKTALDVAVNADIKALLAPPVVEEGSA